MPQLLLELLSEEIPARMQAQAARDLERMARERLAEAGFLPEALTTTPATPRISWCGIRQSARRADWRERATCAFWLD